MHRRIGKAADALAQTAANLRTSYPTVTPKQHGRCSNRPRRQPRADRPRSRDESAPPSRRRYVVSAACSSSSRSPDGRPAPTEAGAGRAQSTGRSTASRRAGDRRDKVRDGRGAVAMKTLIEITASECVSYAIRLGLVRG